MADHAKLSPSGAYRWMNCPRSVELSCGLPDEAGECAAQGTEAHALAEYKIRKAMGMAMPDPREGMQFLDAEMEEATDSWAQMAMEFLAEAKAASPGAFCYPEVRLDLSRWLPEGFGTADAIIGTDGQLTVADFKYGSGVPVEAEGNPQLMIYALGAMHALGWLYGFDRIRMVIFQPRRGGFRSCEMSAADLLLWGDLELRPAAEAAFKGEGEFKAGDWCRFCKAKTLCRAHAEENLKLARYDFAPPAELEDSEIEVILPMLDGLETWAGDIKAYALKRALEGHAWSGFKLVEGRSNRRYTDEKAVADVVIGAGYDPYEKSILGITDMQRLLGRKKFEELLGGLLVKPQGKPTLVPDTDKRPAFSNSQSDFSQEV